MGAEGVEEFRRAAAALRGAEKEVLSQVAKSMRVVSKPIVGAIRNEVRSSAGHTEPGSKASKASVERQLYALGKARTLHHEGTGLLVERRVRSLQRKLQKVASLRESIASAAGASVSAGVSKIALSFRVRASQLPPSQRKLPRRWDAKTGWKHPVYGNRDVWVKQYGNPYFVSEIYPRRDEVEKGVVQAMSAAAEKIVHPEV